MKIVLFLVISLGINMTLYAQRSTIGKVLSEAIEKADNVFRSGSKLGQNFFTQTVRKAMTKGEFRDFSERQLRHRIHTLKHSKNCLLTKPLTQSDFIEKASLSSNLRKLGYGRELIEQIDELPINKELSRSMQQYSNDPQLLERLAKDLKGNEALLIAMNETPMLTGYAKLAETSLRTDVTHLHWINNMQHYSSKLSNQRKLMNKYNIKDLRVTEKDGIISYYDADELLAQEKNNVITAWAGGNASKGRAVNRSVNNLLNQNLLPNSKYIIDDKYEYLVNEKGLVKEISTSDFGPVRSRNADIQAIGRDGFGERSGKFAGGRAIIDKDDGGHLIANQLGGPSELINIVPQHMSVNRGHWKEIESKLSKALKEGKETSWKVKINYDDIQNVERPSSFDIEYWIDGIMQAEHINNPVPIR